MSKIPPDPKNSVPETYPHRLSFYLYPPSFTTTLEHFESSALTRLKLLSEIETAASRNRPFEDRKNRAKLMGNFQAKKGKGMEVKEERESDVVGHFVLRLAFCRSDELRDRFVRAETALFKHRWETDTVDEREMFFQSLLDMNILPLKKVDEVELDQRFGQSTSYKDEKGMVDDEVREKAMHGIKGSISTLNPWIKNWEKETIYKTQWINIPELISTRRLFIQKGTAYLTSRDVPFLVFSTYSQLLQRSLLQCARALPSLEGDTRIPPILRHLEQCFLSGGGEEFTFVGLEDGGEEVRGDMIPGFARDNSFPFCMRHLYDTLKKDGHLKHYARLQFGLFLKGIGLSIDEALRFWKQAFTRSDITADRFEKEYKYNIRHSYGLEGRRMNYPPKSCQKIIMTDPPGPHDAHGCPFRHFDAPALSTALVRTYGIERGRDDHKEIVEAAKNKLYHVSCTRLFEITHGMKRGEGMGGGEIVDHPNRWFQRSREIRKEREGEARMEIEIER